MLPPTSQGACRLLLVGVGLALGPMVALGFARFAYSLLLSTMRAQLHWSFAQAGTMNTANAVGYLAGALGAGPLVARARNRRPFLVALGVTGVALLAAAASGDFAVLLALRLLAGASGAVAFIAGAGLAARLAADLAPRRAAMLLGVYFAGGGAGIVVSAVLVPPAVGLGGDGSWRWGWIVLGAAAVVALAGAVPAALHAPEPAVAPGAGLLGWPLRRLAPTLVAYALFGAGYIAYVTFIVAFVKSEGLTPGAISAFWAALGAAAVIAAFAWGPALGRLRGGRGPAAVLGMVAIGATLPLIFDSVAGDLTSAVVFGGSFLAVVTAVTTLAQRSLTAQQMGPAIAVLTIAFSIGQSAGPILAGMLSDGPRGIRTGLDLSVVLLMAASLVALTQRVIPAPPRTAPTAIRSGPQSQPAFEESEDGKSTELRMRAGRTQPRTSSAAMSASDGSDEHTGPTWRLASLPPVRPDPAMDAGLRCRAGRGHQRPVRHFADGRLDEEECNERAAKAAAAKTRADLAPLLTDLPAFETPPPSRVPPHRTTWWAHPILLAVFVVFAVSWAFAALQAVHHLWVPWPLVIIALIVVSRRRRWRDHAHHHDHVR